MGELDVSDILKDATIVYTFDAKTSQLQSIVMDEFEVDISKAMEQSDPSIGEMSMTMSMELNISIMARSPPMMWLFPNVRTALWNRVNLRPMPASTSLLRISGSAMERLPSALPHPKLL